MVISHHNINKFSIEIYQAPRCNTYELTRPKNNLTSFEQFYGCKVKLYLEFLYQINFNYLVKTFLIGTFKFKQHLVYFASDTKQTEYLTF